MLGKIFLKSTNKLKYIIKTLKEKNFIEIASGYGIITKECINFNFKILNIEIDNNIYCSLKKKYYKKIYILNINLLNFNFRRLGYINILGNIPYYISSKFIKIFKKNNNLKRCFVMLQKEFVKTLSIKNINIYKIEKFIKEDFFPQPSILSNFIKISKRIY
ncbi:rRNA adenine N-6-methyltransferase family protein [Candidatus Vidania fulgoroideorum]